MKKYIVAVLVLLLAMLALWGCNQEKTQQQSSQQIKLYWNVEREQYYDATNKMSMRMRSGDYYRVRFAVDGEQVDLFVPNVEMMNAIDAVKFIGMTVDENNVVTGLYKPYEFTGGVAAYEYYVLQIDGEKVLCNNMANGRGLPLRLKINDKTAVYSVDNSGLLTGLPCTLGVGDQIYAIMGLDGYLSHVYVMPPFETQPVYWNVNRQWDSVSKTSTRSREASGRFTIDFIVDSQAVSLYTTDVEVINQIDSLGGRCMLLEFDENGMITAAKHAKYATGGNTAASWYHVLRLDKVGQTDDISIVADGFYAEKFAGSDKGNTAQCTYSADCKIYDMSGTGAYLGEPTELRLGDQIHCLTDPAGDVCLIFVVSRPLELELYYNIERMYNSDAKKSTRPVSSDGYYHFAMSVNGKKVNLKTQDPQIVQTIDSRAAKVLGLAVEGNIITAAYVPGNVINSQKTVFDYAEITQIADNGMVTAERNGNLYTGIIAPDCEIYDVSNMAGTKGEKTTIQVGDRIYGLADLNGLVHHLYVVGRTINSKIYWNLDRSYDNTTKTTKRVPAEDGYYYIKLAVGTETVTYKTSSKALVNKLDSYVAVALRTRGDVITAVYKYDCAKGYTGGGFASWQNVKSISGKTVTCSDSKGTTTGTMSANCVVYNVSGGSAVPVTKTTLKVGDKIHGIKNSDGKIVLIYVVSRYMDLDLYYNMERKWDSTTGASTRQPDADGWYWFEMTTGGVQTTLKTKNDLVVHAIDERAARVMALELKGDEIIAAYKPSSVKAAATTVFDFTVVSAISEDGVITATRSGNTFTGTLAKDACIYNVSTTADVMGELTQVEVGDTIYGLGSGKNAVSFVYVTQRTPKVETKQAYCQACEQEVLWTAWDGKSALTADHWYLTKNVAIHSSQTIKKESTYCLDLCGFTADGAESLDRIFNVYGTLNIMDSGENGQVVSHYNNPEGRTGSVFYVQDSSGNGYGTLNLYGGTLTSTGMTKQGGIGGVANVFNMYGGTITGGNAAKGGGLFLEANGAVTILGGSITGNQGADIYTKKDLTLGGKVVVGEIYLESGKTIALNGLEQGASIGVTMADPFGIVATNATEADLEYFTLESLVYADGKLIVPEPQKPEEPTTHEDHCVCGGLGQVGDHTCSETIPTWEPWTGVWVDGGYYYLTQDYVVSATIKIDEGQSLHLCLNGFHMEGDATVNRVFNIFGVLDLCDHADEEGNYAGQVSANYDPANNDVKSGGLFYVQNRADAAFNLFGGNLVATTKLNNGGLGALNGKFNLYDGTLTGTTVSGDGAVLYFDGKQAAATLYGGTISGGRATNGGNIYVKAGQLTIDGAEILGGYATNAGGSIRVQADGTLQLISGTISGGEAKGNGGNIYSLGNIVITGGTLEKGKTASGKIGGNLYASGGTLSVANATIRDGSSGTGGNLAIKVADVSITDSTITGGAATTGADIYFEKSDATLTISGCGSLTVYAKAGTINGDSDVTVVTP